MSPEKRKLIEANWRRTGTYQPSKPWEIEEPQTTTILVKAPIRPSLQRYILTFETAYIAYGHTAEINCLPNRRQSLTLTVHAGNASADLYRRE